MLIEINTVNTVETIMLTEERYLGVAWKAGSVHSLCVAIDESTARRVIENSLQLKPSRNEVYQNIAVLIKQLSPAMLKARIG